MSIQYLTSSLKTRRLRTYVLTKRIVSSNDSYYADNYDNYEDVDQDLYKDWQEKARRLQARRWRRIKYGID